MHSEVVEMQDALHKFHTGIISEGEVFVKMSRAIRKIKNAVVDLQLEQCGTCSWKMIHTDTFSAMTTKDLLFAKEEIYKEIVKRIKKRGGK